VDAARYQQLAPPLALDTTERGRELYARSDHFLDRLATIPPDAILALWQGRAAVDPDGIAALKEMLRTAGLKCFRRAAAARRGPERVWRSKYCVAYLTDYLGWKWHRLF
jgi:hypothetical protein